MQRPPTDLSGLRAVVHGEVQGVGYRNFARRMAVARGIAGYVRNRPDGTVEITAEGERAALLSLVEALRRGPSSADVDDVECVWLPYTGTLGPFAIRF